MKVSRKKGPTRVDRMRLCKSVVKFLRRLNKRRTYQRFVRWRGGWKKLDENTIDPKERIDLGLDETEDEWANLREEYK